MPWSRRDKFVLADEADGRRSGELRDSEHAGGVEDSRAGRQHDAGGFEWLHEQLGYLIGEQLRIGSSGFNHGNVLTMEVGI